MPASRESSLPPSRPRRRRPVWAVLAGAAAIVVMAIVAARRTPEWYAARATPDAAEVDRDSRRLVTAVAGLRAAAARPGEWDAAIREEEMNAWLATDLPRNHAALLPAGSSTPRVCLEPGRIRLATWMSAGPLAGCAAVVVEPRLRAANRLELVVSEARLGLIPLPVGPFVHRLATVLGRLGFVTERRRVDGRGVIMVSWDGRDAALRGLSVGAGELVVAGATKEAR